MPPLIRAGCRSALNGLRRLDFVERLNSRWKGWLQTRSALREEESYVRRARLRNLNVLEGDALADAVRRRLAAIGVAPQPRPRGALRLFLAYYAETWEKVLPLVLRRFGRVTEFRFNARALAGCSADEWLRRRNEMNREMLRAFTSAHADSPFDVVVGYLSGRTVAAETLAEMARARVAVVNFCWDDTLNFLGSPVSGRPTGPGAVASAVDLNLTNSPSSRIKYVAEGGLSLFWPEAAEPTLHRPLDVPFTFDVSFVGARYGRRPAFIKELRRQGIRVATFGRGWPAGMLSDEGMVLFYSGSRINLGFSGVGHSRSLACLKARDFEVPMSGGLYLTQHHPALERVYRVGREILTYHDVRDCARKIRWLLEHPRQADAIRRAGRERALRDHTWDRRFEMVFHLLGFLEERSPAPPAAAQPLMTENRACAASAES
ncbi:MAG: glycosyltransferase [Planctomycetota bacterium]